ncbi:MAG: efflux RND transporter periplasmic adaptor subunit [Proteobacteria bacterium]|nr:efflux RND transporter periplasmic adaptor subunit [Pseudomonadota bacterium]
MKPVVTDPTSTFQTFNKIPLTKTLTIPAIIVAVAAAAAIWMVMQQPAPAQRHPEPPILLVNAVAAQLSDVDLDVLAQGAVKPRTETTLVSEVSGQVIEVSPSFVSGGFFNKGDVLVRIDPRNYQAELRRAEAGVDAARSAYVQEKGLAEYAQADWEKLRREGTPTSLALREPQLEAARSSLKSAEADLAKRQGDMARTVIRAPYDGMIRNKIADLGQFVGSGTQIAQIFAVDHAEVRLPLSDRELPFLDLESQPDVVLTAEIGGQTRQWSGTIVRTEGVFDDRSRVLHVVARVVDPYNRTGHRWDYPLRVGTFVNARIQGIRRDDLILLPRSVLKQDDMVWTIGEENRLVPRQVELLRKDERYIYVAAGIEPNTQVCLTNLDNPLPGTVVKVIGEEPVAGLEP